MDDRVYRQFVEKSLDVAAVIDADGRISYASPAVERILGYDSEALEGERYAEHQHPDDREATATAVERLEADPGETAVIETRIRHADGSWRWLEASVQSRFDDELIGGILVTGRDISERKAREREFEALASEYRTLLDTVDDGIFFLAVTGERGQEFRFERVNRTYEEQTGLTSEEMKDRTPKQVFGEDIGAELEANYRRCVGAGGSISYQEEVPVETGARFWQTNLTPVVEDGEVRRLIGITRNVTGQVRRQRQLRSQNEQLEEFAGVVSHDLRNPLGVAQARTALLAEECHSDHVDPVVRSLDRIEAIVRDTLTLARKGQVVGETGPVLLVELVGRCWKSVSTGDAAIEVVDDATIQGDESRLQHVLENLFHNAIEHGGAETTITVGLLDDRGFYVEDTGPGIPPGSRENVFEPGYSEAADGTGFGLTIVRRIAEAHGWEVTVGEGRDGGARFEFTGVDIEVA